MVKLTPVVAERPIVLPALSLDDAVAEESVTQAWQVQEARRVARLPRPRSGPPPRCRGCNRFVGGNPCPCGWDSNGQGYAA